MSDIRYLIGVDGGGTGCRARIRDVATDMTLGEGEGGPGNIRLGMDAAWTNILVAIDAAHAAAGLSRTDLLQSAIGLGLAGIVDAACGAATIEAGPRFGCSAAVSDAHVACLGAFDGRDGAILIAGTGSAGHLIIDGHGRAMFGWGFEVDDKGSAASLGRAAIVAALDGHDGLGARTAFTAAVLDSVGKAPADVVAWVSRARPRDYGGLAPLTMSHAVAGDPVALALVRNAAAQLEAMLSRLVELGGQRVCLVGGMADHIAPWLSPWARGVLSPRVRDAMDGAILLARQAMTQRGQ